MSQAESSDSPRGVYAPKPKADIYTALLVIAFVAIVIACVLLLLEMRTYNFDIRAQEGQLFGSLDRSLPVALRTPIMEHGARIAPWPIRALG